MEKNNNNNLSFWQFSDQLRLQNENLANLSLNDSIWSVSSKRPENRRNFDIRVGGDTNNNNNKTTPPTPTTPVNKQSFNATATTNYADFNNFNGSPTTTNYSNFKHWNGSPTANDFNTWKLGSGLNSPNFAIPPPSPQKFNGFNNNSSSSDTNSNSNSNSLYPASKPYNRLYNSNNNNSTPTTFNLGVKGYYNTKFDHSNTNNFLNLREEENNNNNNNNYNYNDLYPHHQFHHNGGVKTTGKKNSKDGKKKDTNNNSSSNKDGGADKRFKTLPPSESLPRNETIGGYIFVCNNDTMEENLKRQLFGLPPRYRDSVRAITPGLPLFLYNYSTHQLHGIYEAASFGGTNIDATAWEDKKNPGESRFPAQVRVQTRKICDPLDEDAFRPILHHYDGPKFRLELSIPEAISLLDIFAETSFSIIQV